MYCWSLAWRLLSLSLLVCEMSAIVLNSHWKDWCWNSSTLTTWCKELIHLKRPWWWASFKAGGEGDERLWDGWMASLSGHEFEHWWWTGKPGVLQSIGLQRVRHDWATVLNWAFWKNLGKFYKEKGMDKLSEEAEGLGSLLRSIQLDLDGGHPD